MTTAFKHFWRKAGVTGTAIALGLAAFIFWGASPFARAHDLPETKPGPEPADNHSKDTNAPPAKEKKKSPDDLIQISFQNAQVDMIVQWLAETTEKSVVKHPQVQCQLTIVGSKKVTRREAVSLVYRALALEGFTAIEDAKSIQIMPDNKEPKMSPSLVEAGQTATPGSRQKVVRVFPMQHTHAVQLRDKVKAVLSEKAIIDIDDQANALVITDYSDNVAVAEKLISELDTEKAQDLMVRVIPLKNANAQDLANEISPFYGKPAARRSSGGGGGGGRFGMMGGSDSGEGGGGGGGGGKEGAPILEISANERSNSLMIYSSEADFKEIQQLVATLDTEDAQEKVMRSFDLKNADCEDVARQLDELFKETESSGNRYPFYWDFGGGGNTPKKISVVSDRRRNAIIVQGAPLRMDAVAKMVEALDQPIGEESLAPKIYVLKYVSAADIEDVLNELFLKKTQQQRPYWWDENPEPTADRDVGPLYGKVRITSEPYSNAIIVTSNSKESLAAVEEVLRQLDVPSEAGETTFRIGLRFADAPTMANSINVLFAKGGSPPMHAVPGNNQNQPQQNQQNQNSQQPQTGNESTFQITEQVKEESYYPWLGGQPDTPRSGNDTRALRPVSDLIGRIRVVPDPRSNSLLISANVHFFPQVLKLIEDMDVPTAEVLIEARIVEVSSDFLDQLGVRWSPNGTASFSGNDFDNGFVASASGQYQSGFGGKSAVNNPGQTVNNTSAGTTTSQVASALTSLRTGIINNTISMDFLIQFLHERANAVVLADPHLEIGDNEHGKLFVGERVPVSTGVVNPSLGGSSTSIAYNDVGVTLEVEPHINDTGEVTLRVLTESSTLSPVQGVANSPIINTANFHTELTATNGQTLILGGIIQKQSNDTFRKTPFFGSIPGLKWAFNKKDTSNQRTELLVFLRPKVTRTQQQAQALLEEVKKKTPLIQDWERSEAAGKAPTAEMPKSEPPAK